MSVRRCGECTLCCKLVPVAEISKPAGQPCLHQRSKGCRIYHKREFPTGCSLWSCRWLLDESLPIARPDHSRYVIDPSPDFIHIYKHPFRVPFRVAQIWVDPRFPNAHRDDALRRWLEQRWATHEELGLVRFDALRGMVLLPPDVTGGNWHEEYGSQTLPQHSAAEIFECLNKIRRR